MNWQESKLYNRLMASRLFKDSFWAVFGNGMGYGLLLLAGIIIARFLGKDVYGEYGMVKTTMFQIAAFATFGLGYTSTRFVSKLKAEQSNDYIKIINSTLCITLLSSSVLAMLLIVFANPLSNFIGDTNLTTAFRFLGVITIIKAMLTSTNGILAGLGDFKYMSRTNIISGSTMLVVCIPATYYGGLVGSLLSLAISQGVNFVLNISYLRAGGYLGIKHLEMGTIKELLVFSIPVAMQELSYSLCGWINTLLLAKLTTMGELGVYSAAAQWNTIILFVPSLLSNVVLSHLSGSVTDTNRHKKTMISVILVNVCCTLVPFGIVYVSAGIISSMYGPTFYQLPEVLRVMVFTTIFACTSDVFKSEMIAQGRNWATFVTRFSRDVLSLVMVYLFLAHGDASNGALQVAYAGLITSVYFFILMIVMYYLYQRRNEKEEHVITE